MPPEKNSPKEVQNTTEILSKKELEATAETMAAIGTHVHALYDKYFESDGKKRYRFHTREHIRSTRAFNKKWLAFFTDEDLTSVEQISLAKDPLMVLNHLRSWNAEQGTAFSVTDFNSIADMSFGFHDNGNIVQEVEIVKTSSIQNSLPEFQPIDDKNQHILSTSKVIKIKGKKLLHIYFKRAGQEDTLLQYTMFPDYNETNAEDRSQAYLKKTMEFLGKNTEEYQPVTQLACYLIEMTKLQWTPKRDERFRVFVQVIDQLSNILRNDDPIAVIGLIIEKMIAEDPVENVNLHQYLNFFETRLNIFFPPELVDDVTQRSIKEIFLEMSGARERTVQTTWPTYGFEVPNENMSPAAAFEYLRKKFRQYDITLALTMHADQKIRDASPHSRYWEEHAKKLGVSFEKFKKMLEGRGGYRNNQNNLPSNPVVKSPEIVHHKELADSDTE